MIPVCRPATEFRESGFRTIAKQILLSTEDRDSDGIQGVRGDNRPVGVVDDVMKSEVIRGGTDDLPRGNRYRVAQFRGGLAVRHDQFVAS